MGDNGVLHYGINLSVGLSLALPGFQSDMAKGLLNNMPFGALTLVGAKTTQDAIQARVNGADAILLRKEMLTSKGKEQQQVQRTLEHLIYEKSFDRWLTVTHIQQNVEISKLCHNKKYVKDMSSGSMHAL